MVMSRWTSSIHSPAGPANRRLTDRGCRPTLRPVRSIVLAVLSLICAGAGVLATPVPVVGVVFSLAAPVLALVGVVLGGVDLSQRKREGRATEGPLAGVILSALCFFPALATTLTCGVCNALWSAAPVTVQRDLKFDVRSGSGRTRVSLGDGGVHVSRRSTRALTRSRCAT